MDINILKRKIQSHGIHGLYYFSKLKNLESILKHGIYSFRYVEEQFIKFDAFANPEVQSRRDKRLLRLISNTNNTYVLNHLHTLVPLYFTPRTPTLYAVREIQEEIFFIQINPEIICNNQISYCFTDGNAASRNSNFYTDIEDLNKLRWDIIHADFWTDFEDGKRFRNSEFIIYPSVSINFFNKLVVINENNKAIVEKIIKRLNNDELNNLKIEINKNYFF